MDFYVTVPPPVYLLDAKKAFESLNGAEQEYLFACLQASWIGGLIDLLQTSPESAGIFLFIHKYFKSVNFDSLIEKAAQEKFSNDEINHILAYFASVLGNLGNYLSFGDTKFIPAITPARFREFLSLNEKFNESTNGLKALWEEICPAIYSLHPRRLRLGFGPTELNTYYSGNCSREDAELIQKYLEQYKMEAYNTRLFKLEDSSSTTYFLRFASAIKSIEAASAFETLPPNCSLKLEYGDFSELMTVLVECCQYVKDYALNETEKEMWKLYEDSFRTGSISQHKDASRHWVKDKNPVVENYIGFIESYRDPLGVRGEFEGFVAVVNKSMSAKFQSLVENAVQIISQLPWPPTYEKDHFLQPDFTSLEVVAFATSGIPVGINIPNYDDIRQTEGFKNVSLGNVLSARFKDPKTEFVRTEDKPIYLENVANSFELQVGLHELLGHGSGKLFKRNPDGSFNFDIQTTKDIYTNGPIESWYEPGETWDSKFASLSSAMEECRAECVGIYLCNLPNVLRIFEFNMDCQSGDVPDVVYINWLSMVRSGVTSMEFYSPAENAGDTGAWRQAHCCARYAILRVLIEADESLVRIEEVIGEDGAPDISIFLDRKKILSVARPAIGRFLEKLQYYKSTGNAKDGCPFFQQECQLLPEHLKIRKIVIDRKQPRPILVQHGLCKSECKIDIISYPPTYSGLIQSFVDRFTNLPLGHRAIEALESVWRQEKPYFDNIPL